MEIGNFLGKLKGSEPAEPKKFLALVLTDEVVQAAVWEVSHEKTEIVSLGTPVEWDGETATTTELVSACDATISGALEGLTPEPTEMVVGVAYSWTDKNGILGAKRELLKAICKELELKALGFVVLTDSILRYLKMQEGTPATSILIELTRREIVLVLVRLGRIEATQVLERGEDLVADVEEGISHFPSGDHLPSRIIIECGLGNCEDLVQSLVGNDWQNKFNFLHLPKIESLPRDTPIRAVAVAGGSEVARSIGFTVPEPLPSSSPDSPLESPKEILEVRPADEQLVEEPVEDQFEEPTMPKRPEPDILSAQDAGFKVGGSLSSADLSSVELPSIPIHSSPPIPKKSLKLPSMPKISLPKLHLPKFSLPRLPALILFGSVLLIGLIAFLFIWLLPKSTVTLSFIPKPLDESVSLTLSESANALDTSSAIVPVERSTVEVSGTKELDTTGKKTIGDPAKGQVTIYNRTSLTKTFNKGTLLTGEGLKFTLDTDVTIASKSAGSDYVDVPGKSNTAVTASAIGSAGNLSSNTEFTIASFGKDSYVAKNDSALSGGSSKEVQVVAAEDKTALVKALTADLLTQAKTQVESENNPSTGYYVLESGSKILKETYNQKVGAEATTLSGEIDLNVVVLRYKKSDITELVASALSQKIPAGYTQVGDIPLVELGQGTEQDSGEITTTAKVTISLIPTLNEPELKASLRGKSGLQVQDLLSALPGIRSADVKITPLWLPPKLKSMPRNTKNIQIVTSSSL